MDIVPLAEPPGRRSVGAKTEACDRDDAAAAMARESGREAAAAAAATGNDPLAERLAGSIRLARQAETEADRLNQQMHDLCLTVDRIVAVQKDLTAAARRMAGRIADPDPLDGDADGLFAPPWTFDTLADRTAGAVLAMVGLNERINAAADRLASTLARIESVLRGMAEVAPLIMPAGRPSAADREAILQKMDHAAEELRAISEELADFGAVEPQDGDAGPLRIIDLSARRPQPGP